MVKLQPHRQSLISGHHLGSSKLTKRLYGPFSIIAQYGKTAYKLQLPESAHIHSVFHISMLKPFYSSSNTTPPLALPTTFINHQPLITPLAIVSIRREPNCRS